MNAAPKKPDHSARQFVVALAVVLTAVTFGTLFTMRFEGPRPANKTTALGHVVPPPVPAAEMRWIPAGTFQMGSDAHYKEEAPVHEVTVDGFWMDQYTVTNRDFRCFVEATGRVI